MNDTDFITVFNAADIGYRYWWFPATGLIFIYITVFKPKLIAPNKPTINPWLRKLAILFSVFWTATAFVATFGGYIKSREMLLSGHADYVEGVVQDFVPLPYMSRGNESFSVKGIHFSYADSLLTSGFNNTASHGGPIREGLYVRIWYSGNDILKLQLLKNVQAPSTTRLTPPTSAIPNQSQKAILSVSYPAETFSSISALM